MSLSPPLMSKNLKFKKVIKSFVPEPISRVFGFLYVYAYEHNEREGGARGVMVIVAGIGHGDTSSNPGLIAFHIALIPLGKVWIQLLWETRFFSLGEETSLGEAKLWIQTCWTPLKKLTLCHILPERRGWVNMMNIMNVFHVFVSWAYILDLHVTQLFTPTIKVCC